MPPKPLPRRLQHLRAFLSTLPYIAFAVFLIAGLKAAGAEAVIADAFKGREVRMIVLAALFGGLAPFCSCEVIPFIAGSPLIDPPTLLITAAALGWPFAIGKAVAAVALGLFGGFMVKAMLRTNWFSEPLKVYTKSGCGCGPDPFSGRPQWRSSEPYRKSGGWTGRCAHRDCGSSGHASLSQLLCGPSAIGWADGAGDGGRCGHVVHDSGSGHLEVNWFQAVFGAFL